MKRGDLLLDEVTGYYCIFLGYSKWSEIEVMYPDGTTYIGDELRFKEI